MMTLHHGTLDAHPIVASEEIIIALLVSAIGIERNFLRFAPCILVE